MVIRRYTVPAMVCAALALAAPASLNAAAKPAAKASGPGALTGMWLLRGDDFGRRETPPFTPQAAAAAEKARKAVDEGGQVLSDAARKCLPIGMPGFMSNEFALEILESPGRVTLISENSPLVRSVYLNRKTHNPDAEPGWNGHSIGHWEGATLVIDTVSLNDRKSHIPRGQVPSAKTHIVERLHLEQGGKLLVNQMTFEDPDVLTGPYTTTTHYERLPADSELWEYACEVDATGWSERFANDPAAGLKSKPQEPTR